MLIAIPASLLAALVPTVLYTLLVWWADRHEREPLPLLLTVFFWGAVPAVVAALVIEGTFDSASQRMLDRTVIGGAASTALVAPIVEEVFKALALLAVATWAAREFDGILDGIVYGAVIGFGFAMTENVLYFIGAFAEQGWGWWAVVVMLRAFVFGFNHAFFTACTGIGFGLAALSRRRVARWLFPVLGLAAAIFFHGLHNLGAELADVTILPFFVGVLADWGGFWLLVLIVILTWDNERRWLRDGLADEVGILLQPQEYQAMLTFSARAVRRLAMLPLWQAGGPRRVALFQRQLVDLAFIKTRLRRVEQTDAAQADDLRRRAAQLRTQIMALRPDLAPVIDPVSAGS